MIKMKESEEQEMEYIRGDCHGDPNVWSAPGYGVCEKVKEGDQLFICGDFGYVDKPEILDQMEMLPFTILFCDGNHENFGVLNQYPIELWNGGKIHRIRENVIHLMRGQVYEINGKICFVMGGAASLDKRHREEGISWWPEEVPSEEEIAEAKRNLKRVNYEVDYIITHAPTKEAMQEFNLKAVTSEERLRNFLDKWIPLVVTYKHWYFGHIHLDTMVAANEKQMAVWSELQKIGD